MLNPAFQGISFNHPGLFLRIPPCFSFLCLLVSMLHCLLLRRVSCACRTSGDERAIAVPSACAPRRSVPGDPPAHASAPQKRRYVVRTSRNSQFRCSQFDPADDLTLLRSCILPSFLLRLASTCPRDGLWPKRKPPHFGQHSLDEEELPRC